MIRVLVTLAVAAVICTSSFAQEPVDVYVSGEDGYHTYRIPALVVTKNSTLLGFYEGRKTSASDAGDIDLLLKRSTDSGATWSNQQIVHEEGGDAEITIGNPCPIVDTETGRVHLLFTRNNTRAFHTSSDDDGVTWSEPRELTDTLNGFDFPWTRVGTGPGHGLQLSGGRLLAPIWLNERIRFNYRSAALYSDDHGETWKASGLVGPDIPDTNECMAVEMANGRVYLNMRARDVKTRSVAWSEDGGETWSTPVPDAGLPDPVCQASVVRVGKRVFFANPSGPGRANLSIRVSEDGAETWDDFRVVHEGPAAYSDMGFLPGSNELLCLYECGEEGPYERIRIVRVALAKE